MKKLHILVCIVISSFFFFGCTKNVDTSKNQLNTDENSIKIESYNEESPELEKATVVRVVDGDTVIVNLNGVEEKIRLVLVNTPESTTKKEPFGKEASDYTKKVLKIGREVYLEKDVSDRDQYGRLLRYLWIEKPSSITKENVKSKMFNANLLINGYAMVSTFPPDVKYKDFFIDFQREARDSTEGLWALDAYSHKLDNNKIVYYTKNGKSYHFHKGCKSLEKSKNILSGKLKEVMNLGKDDACNLCTK